MLITLLAFATFAVSIKYTQNRLQLSFTLVLTGVAFKFVVNQSLPRISYLTYMVTDDVLLYDWFIFLVMYIMPVFTIKHDFFLHHVLFDL